MVPLHLGGGWAKPRYLPRDITENIWERLEAEGWTIHVVDAWGATTSMLHDDRL